ncbi:hypothetical protein FPOAC1_003461 [Fusarium poae]|uniref:hypothetical protein n=1 Tax=Fusarium poae TaxID=36050 RepID=UPI001CE8DED3|nr:hypothetical protein FPOAC1_003461 [Fusarium poae]KAG8677443.1 hypothetical protein FPOAC1_003461 [Fusarium poae]
MLARTTEKMNDPSHDYTDAFTITKFGFLLPPVPGQLLSAVQFMGNYYHGDVQLLVRRRPLSPPPESQPSMASAVWKAVITFNARESPFFLSFGVVDDAACGFRQIASTRHSSRLRSFIELKSRTLVKDPRIKTIRTFFPALE